MEFESLEKKFEGVLQRHGFLSLIITSTLFLFLVGFYNVSIWVNSGESWLALIMITLAIIILLLLLLLTCLKKLFTIYYIVYALVLWILIIGLMFILVFYQRNALYSYVYITLYYICVNYTLVPLPLWLAITLGMCSTVINLILLHFLSDPQQPMNAYEVIFLGCCFACTNALGITYKMLLDVYTKKAFADTKNCVESRIKLEHERQQQEQLLLSVMPVHLAVEMKNKMLDKLKKPKKTGLSRRKSAYGRFQDLYIRVHENVSILYADIVNFTPLSSSCSPGELVSLLNELFGRFDKLAHQHDCTRIKFLGDCYYCVSGLPVARPKHARNSVEMGLDMLAVIKEVRAATGSNIDMRIGIHTGVVLSGVIGLKKWQYDVWSDDVVIANCLESCGVPGMIHISKTTLLELNDNYQVIDANNRRDSTLVDKNIDTFLIKTIITDSETPTPKFDTFKGNKFTSHPLKHVIVSPINIASFLTSCGEPKPFSTTPEAIYAEKVVFSSISQMEASFEILKKPLYIFPKFGDMEGLNWLAINFTNSFTNEVDCWQSHDKHFVRGALVICAVNTCLAIVSFLIERQSSISQPLLGTLTAIYGIASIFLCIFFYFRNTKHVKIHKMKCSVKVKLKLPYRLAIYTVLILGSFLLSLVLISSDTYLNKEIRHQNSTLHQEDVNNNTPIMLNFLFGDILFLIGLFSSVLFLQLSYAIKFPSVILLSAAHLAVVFIIRWKLAVRSTLAAESVFATMLFLTIVFSVQRRGEIVWKLGWIWQQTFGVEREDVETVGSLNKLLLENVLPCHVADHFLNSPRGRSEELYHESYDNICVMFASIPNFWEFYQQSAVTKHGIECLRILNEIICDFDQLLSKPKFSSVEKIKTIGSTYMAASGVQRGRFKTKGSIRRDHCTAVIAEYAQTLFEILENLNKNSFTQFKLRIGINNGPAVAGVIGANKPQYDIWGDTVNVASRMESTGVMGKIHCREETADILKKKGYVFECRGEIKVKGKAPMVTYLLNIKQPPQTR